MRIRESMIHVALVGSAAAFAPPVQALETFCVTSLAQLNAAWQVADDDDVRILLATGTYDLTASCLDVESLCRVEDHDVEILGGYNSDCSARSQDPGATVLTAPGRVIVIGSNITADVRLERLTIRGFAELEFAVETILSGDYRIELQRVHLDQGGGVDIGADTVVLDNTLVSRMTGSVALSSFVDNLTVRNSTFTQLQGGVQLGRQGPVFSPGNTDGTITNSIFWDNAPFDLDVQSDDLVLRNNLYGIIFGPLKTPPIGTITADPRFVAPASGNFRLQGSSPAINTGAKNAALQFARDLAGGPRWFGDAPDRGAYETEIGTTATTIVVQNTLDSGPGSLRQAIIDANAAPNVNRIEFSIGSSCGPRVINLNSLLPAIVQPLVIDAYTQPGASRNTLEVGGNAVRCVVLNGQNSILNAISVSTAEDVAVSLDGLGFGGFVLNAVNLVGGNGHRVVGSQFGGRVGPTATAVDLLPNLNGIQVGALFGSAVARDVEIGGDAAGERNVFSDMGDAAIRVGVGGRHTRIVNNYIGVGPGGSQGDEANFDGIVINGQNTIVRGNVISNNGRHGVLISGDGSRRTTVENNRIGIAATCLPLGCASTFGNAEDGIRVANGAFDNMIRDNIIRFNGGDGVVVASGVRNAIVRNELTDNGEQAIDLGDDGTSPPVNNAAPPAGAANFGQNRPQLTSASGGDVAGFVGGTLTSANGVYRIDIHEAVECGLPIVNPTPGGEPRRALAAGFATITNGTASSNGSASFTVTMSVPGSPAFFATPRRLTATATRLATDSTDSPPRNTSETSACISYTLGGDPIFANGFE